MMSLTKRQGDLLRLEICERSQGRRLKLRTIMAALSVNQSNASILRARLMARVTNAEINALLPRDGEGRRLQFIPVAALNQGGHHG